MRNDLEKYVQTLRLNPSVVFPNNTAFQELLDLLEVEKVRHYFLYLGSYPES